MLSITEFRLFSFSFFFEGVVDIVGIEDEFFGATSYLRIVTFGRCGSERMLLLFDAVSHTKDCSVSSSVEYWSSPLSVVATIGLEWGTSTVSATPISGSGEVESRSMYANSDEAMDTA